ncbi:cytochrome b [Sphingosinithalassobacter sp. CS137]|uniref:cytochrome b n=1 Tax=Sphingosinithalassobacter sp. CS137 TaxID=2762748 RepID=UPI00165E8E03|nr:cytochrome b [Sphingosinithalassobacter sp. CS137]
MAVAFRGRYDRVAITFHWVIAALVLVNLAIGLFHESLFDGMSLMPFHKSNGILILGLSIARLGWRLGHRPPSLPAGSPRWERALARSVHWLFYTLLILLPLSGWIFSSNPARPRPIDWFGLFELPVLPVGEALAGAAHGGHDLMGFAMAGLVVLHVAAALRHHFVLRDRTLARMLP